MPELRGPVTATATARADRIQGLADYFRGFDQVMRGFETPEGFAFKTQDAAIQHHGSLAPAGPYTDDECAAILAALEHLSAAPEIKMCFRNATMLAEAAELAGVDIAYAEGKCAVMIPIDHAWCALPSGRPVDVTLRTSAEYDAGDDLDVEPERLLARAERNLAENPYWGYAVPGDYRRQHLERTGCWSPVIDDPEGGHPLMRSRTLPWDA